MKRVAKRALAAVCALVLVLGSGLSMISLASDTDVVAERAEWIVYSGNKDFEIDPGGDLVVSVSGANVTLPSTVQEKDLGLSITMTIPNADALTSLKDGMVELAQDTFDEAEISWALAESNLKVGENVIMLQLADAVDSGRSTEFSLEETINWFRIYSTTSSKGSIATLKEVKLVDNRTAGLLFGEEKTADTYLQLTEPLESTPQSIEASVKMDADSSNTTEWMLRSGASNTTSSGHTVTNGTTVEGDKPGAGLNYTILNANNSAISGFSTFDGNLKIDATGYELEDLAVGFWVYSNKAGKLGTGDQFRIGSGEFLSSDALIYYYSDIDIAAGWNYIELPLSTWKTDIKGNFTVSNINCFGFTAYNLAKGEIRHFADMKLVVLSDEPEEPEQGTETTAPKWTLRSGDKTTGASHTITTGTTVAGDKPGAGMTYSILNASNSAINGFNTLDNNLGINAGEYQMSELAVSFWVYSNKAGKLGTGDQFRIGSGEYLGSNALIYYYSDITVEAGWNYIQIPLDKWKTDIKGNFAVSNINSFGFTAYNLAKGEIRYFGDFELTVLEPTSEWELRSGSATANVKGHKVTTGTTVESDKPGAGMNYAVLDASNVAISGFETLNNKLGINASGHDMKDLAVAFWVYSNKAGKLGTGDQLRIGSGEYLGSNALIYYYNDITVEAGWNYIELPLDKWKTDIKGNFSVNNINCFGFAGYNLAKGEIRYFGDIKLVVMEKEPITTKMLRPGTDIDTTSGHTLTTAATVAGDRPGAGKNYSIIDARNAAVNGFGTLNGNLKIDASASEMSDLAVTFWVYSNKAGKLGTGDQFRIGSGEYLGSNALIYYYSDITVKAGWNYIKLPLDTWKTDIKGSFSLDNINVFGFTNYNLEKGQVRYFSDIQLINMKLVEDEIPAVQVNVAENVTTLAGNYMIFSNANAAEETNPYALFITADGYPALLYGTTQFTLTQSVRTGEWVDIAAVRDADGYVSFYINGEIAARSDVPVGEIGAPATAHCIGADGSGGQIMDGTIADVRVWGDTRTADEIQKNLIEKEAGIIGNGLNANTKDLLGSWFLVGNIQDVLEEMPDTSANTNTAVYRGSRADDWIDYTIPEEIGDDYWSIVFVPDIQNLIRTKEYNKTWEAMGEWIAENVDAENIQHVIGAGDSTWNATREEFNRAMLGFNKFNDLVPTNVIIGNHDYHWGTTERVTTMYQTYFGEAAIQNKAVATTYEGYFDDPAGKSTTENSYYRFSVNGTKWMILQLEYHPRVSVMEWAKEILEAHPDDNVILTTHAYIDGWGEYASNTYMEYTQGDANAGGSIGDTSEPIWNEYLNEYTNIKMILCGHRHNGTGSVVERIETNVNGDKVPALMINAQDVDAGDGSTNIKEEAYYDDKPIGMLGILRFSADGHNVALQYYAPTSDKSFSPEDPFGNEDSNNLAYTIDVETCSHNNTIMTINDDAATGSTNGYTGDTYCVDCETMVTTGEIIPATGVKQGNEEGQQAEGNGPGTGDYRNPALWFTLLAGSAIVVCYVRNKCRKEEE